MADNTITTVDGRQLAVHPVPQRLIQRIYAAVEAEFRARGEPLDKPTYTIETKLGATETYDHDEKSVAESDEATQETWAAWKDATARLASEQSQRVAEVLLIRALGLREVPPEWLEEQAFLGLSVPEDPKERLLEYIQSDVLTAQADMVAVISKAVRLSLVGAVSDEELDAIEATFRRSMASGRRSQADAQADQGADGTEPESERAGSVVVQPGDGGGDGGEGVGVDAKPMGQAE